MDAQTNAFYSQNAARLVSHYEVVSGQWHRTLERTFANAAKVLDVGCGTGRDLVNLLQAGKDAYGIDPCRQMIDEAQRNLESNRLSANGRLFVAGLPSLTDFDDAQFDGILCSAVLMHLPEEELFDTVYSLGRILKHNGVLLISVPAQRPDVDTVSRRDKYGRLFNYLPAARLHLLFERVGFVVRQSETVSDSLGRPEVEWQLTEFLRLSDSGNRPLSLVESVLTRDKKDATYKLGSV